MTSATAFTVSAGLPGEMLPLPAEVFSTVASRQLSVANRAHLLRFQPTENRTIRSIRFEVLTAATVDDAVDVGIYDAATLTRLASAGATTGKLNSTGVKSVPLAAAVDVQPDTVYVVAISSALGGTGAILAGRGMASVNSQAMFCTDPAVAGFPASLCAVKDTTHPLPASIVTPTFTGTGTMPQLAVLELA